MMRGSFPLTELRKRDVAWQNTKLAHNKAAGLKNKMEDDFLQNGGGSRWVLLA